MVYEDIDKRMLNREETPTFDDMIRYCGESGNTWKELDRFLTAEYRAEGAIHFPYGTEGWGVRYSRKNKRIIDVFAENGTFLLRCRIRNHEMDEVYRLLNEQAKEAWDNRLPCGNGKESWMYYRASCRENMHDIKMILRAKYPQTLSTDLTVKRGGEN